MKHTSLYDFQRQHGARFVPFCGWELPVQFTGILDEHKAVRSHAGLFDVSHMGEVEVTGTDSEKFLDAMVANKVEGLPAGKALYTLMCYEDGGVVDDIIIYRLAPERFFLCLNACNTDKDVAWIQEHTGSFDCQIAHVSHEWVQLALQGPKAWDIIASLGVKTASLSRFDVAETALCGVDTILARTGYTGEDGMEIFCPWESGPTIAEQIFKAGAPFGLKLCGLGARDSLRLEAGYPLYGHEISESISPLQAGLGWTVKLSKPGDFIGKAALSSEKKRGPARRIIHFKLEGRRIARQGAPVFCGERQVGEIVSGTLSPIINHPIGTALIETSNVDPDALHVDLRGHKVNLDRTKPPLHKP